jgi:hypothetical protein
VTDLTRILPKLLKANGGNPELAVKLAWGRAAGAGLKPHATALRLDEKTLTVAVADAIWQKQLQHMSAELIFRVNNVLGQRAVESIVFRIDAAALSPGEARIEQPTTPSQQKTAAPTDLLFAANSIADEDLRARFIRAAENCIARRDAGSEGTPT